MTFVASSFTTHQPDSSFAAGHGCRPNITRHACKALSCKHMELTRGKTGGPTPPWWATSIYLLMGEWVPVDPRRTHGLDTAQVNEALREYLH